MAKEHPQASDFNTLRDRGETKSSEPKPPTHKVGQEVTFVGEDGKKAKGTVTAAHDDGSVDVRVGKDVHPKVPVGAKPLGNAHVV